MDLSVCGILKEGNEMIKVNVNKMDRWIRNDEGIVLIKQHTTTTNADYKLILGYKDGDHTTHITEIPIFLDDEKRLSEQMKLLVKIN